MHREAHRQWLNNDRRRNMSDLGKFCQCRSVSCPHGAKKCGKQSIWRGGPFAAEGEELVAGPVKGAILDHTSFNFGCQSEAVTTKKCQFS